MKLDTPEELQFFVGKSVSEKNLLGRGYFHCVDGKIVSNPITLPEAYDPDEKYNENEVWCSDIQQGLAERILPFSSDCWLCCLPFGYDPSEHGVDEAYYVIAMTLEQSGDNYTIESILPIIRYVKGMNFGGFRVDTGEVDLEIKFAECSWIDDSIIVELDSLVSGRYIPDGFSLIGKPMISDLSEFVGDEPPYDLCLSSAYRHCITDIFLECDDNNIIQSVEFDCEVETSMFERPRSASPNYADSLRVILYFIDKYTDEQWEQIIKS